MSRYKCCRCEVEHDTDNMVSYCASCYDKEEQKRMDWNVVIEDLQKQLAEKDRLLEQARALEKSRWIAGWAAMLHAPASRKSEKPSEKTSEEP
jgi:hypothetical protein